MTDRENDEQVLRMLLMRYDGRNMQYIAEKIGVSRLTVRNHTNRVRESDEAHEPGAVGFYG